MHNPPFKLARPLAVSELSVGMSRPGLARCCEGDAVQAVHAEAPRPSRTRLADLDLPLHCSVIGTCMGTADLRKLMAKFVPVAEMSDLEIHHDAVQRSSDGGVVTKALNKALDQRHDLVIQRFAKARGAEALEALWDEALKLGEIPGAYWAMLTHRQLTPELRQRVFGDVHMLSHLVGAANRADIRRLVALERENAEWRERAERQQLRGQALVEERDHAVAEWRQALADAEARRFVAPSVDATAQALEGCRAELATAQAQIALQTERRERAEQSTGVAVNELERLRDELAHLGRHVDTLNRELNAAETQLREIGGETAPAERSLERQLNGRRVFYVGGRPSSTPAIRDLVHRHGGDFQHHDGGFEDRKGLLAAGVHWAQIVVFPVDCIDHDSAGNLKRLCARQGLPYVPLRGASVASFVAALSARENDPTVGGASASA